MKTLTALFMLACPLQQARASIYDDIEKLSLRAQCERALTLLEESGGVQPSSDRLQRDRVIKFLMSHPERLEVLRQIPSPDPKKAKP